MPHRPAQGAGYLDPDALLDVVEPALKGKAYPKGDQFTAVDVVTGSGLRKESNLGMGFGMIPKRPALVDYVGACRRGRRSSGRWRRMRRRS